MFKCMACGLLLLATLATSVFAEALDKVVAVVNDEVITASELQKEVRLARQQMQATNAKMPAEEVLRKQVLQHLINVSLEMQLAKQYNMSIDDTQLNTTLTKLASENHLSMTQLQDAVEKQGMAWEPYRESIRKEILLAQVRQKAVARDIKVTPDQVEEYLKTSYKEENKIQATYHIEHLVIPLSEEPTSEELKKAQKKAQEILAQINKGKSFEQTAEAESNSDFNLESGDLGMRHLAELPEIFAKSVVNMAAGQIKGPLRTGNGLQLIRLVAIGGDNSKHEVLKTHLRHILIKPDASMTSREADRQVRNLYQQLKEGRNFAAMAKKYSLDSVSAAKGGDLGWVNPGELVPEVEKAMNSLPLHKVSKPIKSVFGWHLVEVLERKRVNDSESYKREQVRNYLQQRKFAEAVSGWQQQLRAKSYVKIMENGLA